MQSVTLLGNVVSEPEEKMVGSSKIYKFRFCTKLKKKGENVPIWWSINAWGDYWANVLAHVSKGKELLLIGDLEEPYAYVSKEGDAKTSLSLSLRKLHFTSGSKEEKSNDFVEVKPKIEVIAEEDDLPF